jgi:DNA-binding winged helix-turn-helix (wHTH) protein/Tfp pilus assembly protein PilF
VVYRFGQFEVDEREFRLSENKTPVQVEPKVLRLLFYLIENRNRLVLKQELLDNVWPDAMVTENALTRAVGLLRKALNDDSRVPQFIETVPTAGYRFIARVTVVGDSFAVAPTPPVESTSNSMKPRSSTLWVVAASVLLLAAASTGILLYLHRGKKVLTDQDTVVLADFDNSTGDPVFDSTLRRGMAVQLEQSPYLSLIADDRIQQVLQEMGQPADARLTPAVAREICERTSSAAVLDGSIAPLGSQYVLSLRAKDCQSGKVLAEEQVQAARKEDVLHALDQMAGQFRKQVGESLATVEKYETPLAEATTPSLDALKAYSLGLNRMRVGALNDALPFFSRAIELDPNFAAAYEALSDAYSFIREPELSAENIRKAYELRGKVSEPERLAIEGEYYWFATGELEKAVASAELALQAYPRDFAPHIGLGILYARLGNAEKSAEEARVALRLMPDYAANYQNLGADLVNLNRLDEAEAVYKLSDQRNLPSAGRPKSLYLLAFLKGDEARMAQLASSVVGNRDQEGAMFGVEAGTEAWFGRVRAARAFNRRAVESALNRDARETAAGYLVELAPVEAGLGNSSQGRADAEAAIKLAANRDVRLMAALALAQSGDTKSAEKLAAELDKAFPLDTLVQGYWLPVIRAAIALQQNDPSRAVELLQMTSPFDLAGTTSIMTASLLPVYERGEAFLMLRDGNRAAAEFQKFIDYRGMVRNSPFGMLARLGLARAYAMQNDTTKARAAYRDFLTTWKDADPDVPILQQAKAEFARLR